MYGKGCSLEIKNGCSNYNIFLDEDIGTLLITHGVGALHWCVNIILCLYNNYPETY